MADDVVTMEKIVALCKRRGFIFPSSEIYGGLGSTYDYGHYGVLLKNNVKAEWWRAMLLERDDIVALRSATARPAASASGPITSTSSSARRSPPSTRARARTASSPRPATSTSCSR